ncbi:MAG: MFS transporter, partial [Alphaproteobacteria bacterium]|nr:MFS transporter [Alphaproteobacteria bacterium]
TLVTGINIFSTDLLLVSAYIFGGCITSCYSVAIAMMNDRLKPKQRTSATASLILINGMSSCIGPVLIGGLMQVFGPHAFFVSFTIALATLFIFGVYRKKVGKEDVDIEEQGEFQVIAPRASPTAAQLKDLGK